MDADAIQTLLSGGPYGISALIVWAWLNERKERREERKEYDAEIKAKDDAHIATLNSWRADTQVQSDKVSAMAEKFIVAIETGKKGQ